MKFKLHYKEENKIIDASELKIIKSIFSPLTSTVNNICFDVDQESLHIIDILSKKSGTIDFKDAYNNTISLSGSELENILIKNQLYNNLKTQIGISDITYSQAYSAFENLF